jgi:hypothetical protein
MFQMGELKDFTRWNVPPSVGDVVLSTTLPSDELWVQTLEQSSMVEDGRQGAQFSAAEKGGKGMALKIFMGAKPFLKDLLDPYL